MSESQCKECGVTTGGGEYCYEHKPYTVEPLKDGSFRVHRFGVRHVWIEPPSPEPPASELHRYTITSEGASLGYYRLVEDPEGAWVQWAEASTRLATVERERDALLTKKDVEDAMWRAVTAHLTAERDALREALENK